MTKPEKKISQGGSSEGPFQGEPKMLLTELEPVGSPDLNFQKLYLYLCSENNITSRKIVLRLTLEIFALH